MVHFGRVFKDHRDNSFMYNMYIDINNIIALELLNKLMIVFCFVLHDCSHIAFTGLYNISVANLLFNRLLDSVVPLTCFHSLV